MRPNRLIQIPIAIFLILVPFAFIVRCYSRIELFPITYLLGCHDRLDLLTARKNVLDKNKRAAMSAARPTAPYVAEFTRLFPGAQVSDRLLHDHSGQPGFDVVIRLHDLYELRMELPVKYDFTGHTVVGYGEPSFTLMEALRRDDGSTAYYRHRMFGRSEWQTIVVNGGDFESIGYVMIKD